MTKSSPAWLIIACGLSQFIHTVYGSIANIALPGISREFHAGMGSLQWVVSAFVLATASLLAFSGTLADRFGRKRVLIAGNGVMMAAALVCALSPNIIVLIAGRVLQGIGSALIAPAGLALLTAHFPQARRAIAVMWWTTIGSAALAAGPVLGGLLVHDLGWRSVFWAGLPIGVVAVGLAAGLLRETKSETPGSFDPIGQILFILFLAGLAVMLIEGVDLGWTSPVVLVALGVTVGSLLALVWFERRHENPIIPISLFTNRSYAIALTTGLLAYLALAGLLFLNTFYLQSKRDLDATSAGLITIPIALGATIASVLVAHLVIRGYSRGTLIAAGTLLAASSLALWATEDTALWTILVPYFVFGFGFGLVPDPVSVTAISSLPATKAGLASSLISTIKQVGQLVGIAGVGTVLGFAHADSQAVEFDHMGGWVWMLLTAAGLLIVVLNAMAPSTARARIHPVA